MEMNSPPFPLAIASIENGVVVLTGIEDRLLKALTSRANWKLGTASIELYAQRQDAPDPETIYAVFSDSGEIRCWAIDRENMSLKALERDGERITKLLAVTALGGPR